MCHVRIDSHLPTDPQQNLYADLLHAQVEREAGYHGRTGDEVLAEMRQIIGSFKSQRQTDGAENTL